MIKDFGKWAYYKVSNLLIIKWIKNPQRCKNVNFFFHYLKKQGCEVELNKKAKCNRFRFISEICTFDSMYQSDNIFAVKKNNMSLISNEKNAREATAKGAVCLITNKNYSDYPCLVSNNPLDIYAKVCRYYRDITDKVSVVAITGSIGKSTTKNMMGEVYKTTYRTTYTQANGNTRMFVGHAVQRIPDDAERMLQEVHEANLNETRYISEILHPDILCITPIDSSHLSRVGSTEKIEEEICSITEFMPINGKVVVNIDEFNRFELLNGRKVISISEKNRDADFSLCDVVSTNQGLSFFVFSKQTNTSYKIILNNIFAPHNAICALYAFATGFCDGIPPEKIVEGLCRYKTKGVRQNVIHTPDNILVYADCYNAVGRSMKSAIDGADIITVSGKRIAVLGDIKEIGEFTEKMHKDVVRHLFGSKFNYLITLGEEMEKATSDYLENSHIQIINCNSLEEVTSFLKSLVKSGDLVLFKASHSMELEKCIEKLWPEIYEETD